VYGFGRLWMLAEQRTGQLEMRCPATVRAKMRVLVNKILRKYGYPPDLQEAATTTVLQQAEVLCADWAA
jgi:hypothetical protein